MSSVYAAADPSGLLHPPQSMTYVSSSLHPRLLSLDPTQPNAALHALDEQQLVATRIGTAQGEDQLQQQTQSASPSSHFNSRLLPQLSNSSIRIIERTLIRTEPAETKGVWGMSDSTSQGLFIMLILVTLITFISSLCLVYRLNHYMTLHAAHSDATAAAASSSASPDAASRYVPPVPVAAPAQAHVPMLSNPSSVTNPGLPLVAALCVVARCSHVVDMHTACIYGIPTCMCKLASP